jgi:glycosyltransferase involved in cell wall biosynthesis
MSKKICLNMIVKNESAVIERCLSAARPMLDAVVILDTGSTDNTVALIKAFCEKAGLPCHVPQGVFVNFEQARNLALKECLTSSLDFDYVLLIDADLVLMAEDVPDTIKASLTANAYLVAQQGGDSRYSNVRLVKRTANPRYVGVTHEALYYDGDRSGLDALWIQDFGDGGSKSDKFERDLRLLQGGVAAEPDNARYWFYLARTYGPLGRQEEAIATFEKRVQMGGWDEEVFISLDEIAKAREALKQPAPIVIGAYLQAWQFRPTRAEPLVSASRVHRERGEFHLSELYARQAAKTEMPTDILFVDVGTYRWRALDELAIATYWTGKYSESWDLCNSLLENGFLPPEHRARVIKNREFCMAKFAK